MFVFEPPPGVKANLLRTFSAVSAVRMCKVRKNVFTRSITRNTVNSKISFSRENGAVSPSKELNPASRDQHTYSPHCALYISYVTTFGEFV